MNQRVAVVHNGVLANQAELRTNLTEQGYLFESQTDSELIAHLISSETLDAQDQVQAIHRVLKCLDGEFAIVVMFADDPYSLYAASRKSPLIVASSNGRSTIASDLIALTDRGSDIFYLQDDEVAIATAKGVTFSALDSSGTPATVRRQPIKIESEQGPPSKKDFPHYMLKEMFDIPEAVGQVVSIPESIFANAVSSCRGKIVWTGSGSSFYMAMLGQYFCAMLDSTHTMSTPADEARYLVSYEAADTLIALSQSGESFDTVDEARRAKAKGATVVSVCNVATSMLERIAAHQIPQRSGVEVSVLSTKSVICQALIASRLATTISASTAPSHLRLSNASRLASLTHDLLRSDTASQIERVAGQHLSVNNWFFIAKGPLYPVALESALKYREVTYEHSEGISAGMLKHGTISLIDESVNTIALLPDVGAAPYEYAAVMAAIAEVRARGGKVVALGPESLSARDRDGFDIYVPLPLSGNVVDDCIIHLLAGQLLAYFRAVNRRRNIDQPRGLAKSITVR